MEEEVAVHGFGRGPAVCTGVAVQPGGHTVASCGEDGRLVLAPADRLASHQSIDADAGSLTSLCWPTATQVAVATRAGQAKLFDHRAPLHPSSVFYNPQSCASFECIAAHPSQPFLLATGSDDGSVLLWDVRDPRRPRNEMFRVHRGNVWQVGFDPRDARSIVSCAEDGTVAVTRWEDEGRPHETRRLASQLNVLAVNCFDICPYTREHMLVAGSDSGNLLMTKTAVQW
ncbi:Nucleoporin Nup43 [Coemansia interrupta]|uniref:Nucleoporin Nup43 n=1 Tax=Coemansia interrupta TaxID=1126814 RepID=A0A9W8LLV2_9FUNG|nr:Nucleoporin Nup43 [Coemansia interrupta]